jgi:hypothetical protein
MHRLAAAAFAGAALLASGMAAAGPRDELSDAARAFDESVLRDQDDSTRQLALRKWKGPIKLAVRNPSRAPNLVQPAIKAIRTIAEQAKVEVTEVEITDSGANLVVFFDDNEIYNGQLGCQAKAPTRNWLIERAEIKISPSFRGQIDNCIIHEALHAFGFYSHPHGVDSVLSYVYKRTALTRLDIYLIKTLYDPALRPGLAPLQASVQGCRILARLMASSEQDTREICDPHRRAERTANGETFQIGVAALKRTTGTDGTCAERATYWVNLYPDRVSFAYVDTWRTFAANASGAFGGSFTVQAKPNPLDFKLSGNLKSRVVNAENLTQKCAWDGTLN